MKMGTKQKSISSKKFVRGGSGSMHGKQTVGTQVPGQSAQQGSGGGKFAKGGSGTMHGKQSARPQAPGKTSVC
jgi:hypothetical protein